MVGIQNTGLINNLFKLLIGLKPVVITSSSTPANASRRRVFCPRRLREIAIKSASMPSVSLSTPPVCVASQYCNTIQRLSTLPPFRRPHSCGRGLRDSRLCAREECRCPAPPAYLQTSAPTRPRRTPCWHETPAPPLPAALPQSWTERACKELVNLGPKELVKRAFTSSLGPRYLAEGAVLTTISLCASRSLKSVSL